MLREGFAVDTCADSSTGLRLTELNHDDAVLLDLRMSFIVDLRMSFIDSLRFLERLRAVKPALPMVIVTGHAAEASNRAAERLGICECVAKPFTPVEIAGAVRRSLRLNLPPARCSSRLANAGPSPSRKRPADTA